jgi:hypothetical protein
MHSLLLVYTHHNAGSMLDHVKCFGVWAKLSSGFILYPSAHARQKSEAKGLGDGARML